VWLSSAIKRVLAVIKDGRTVTEPTAAVGVSRQTLHAWLGRYEQAPRPASLPWLPGCARLPRLVASRAVRTAVRASDMVAGRGASELANRSWAVNQLGRTAATYIARSRGSIVVRRRQGRSPRTGL
jgi:hypothetical protein